MTALIRMYATAKKATHSVFLGATTLGFAEDFVCVTYFVSALWLFDVLKRHVGKRFSDWKDNGTVTSIRNFTTFAVSWLLCITMMIPFSVDLLLVRLRGMRFTFALVVMAINEKDSISAVSISADEVNQVFLHGAKLVVVATLFASMRTGSVDGPTCWNPLHNICCQSQSNGTKRLHDKLETNENVAGLSSRSVTFKKKVLQDGVAIDDTVVQIGEPVENMETEKMLDQDNAEIDIILPTSHRIKQKLRLKSGITVIVGLVVVPAIVVVASSVTSPLIAYSALNTSLNELFGGALQPTLPDMDGTLPWPEKFIHTATEDYTLLGSNSLYRRTTGFHGELAFNVSVASNDPPNVLLIVVESFRYHDFHYLVERKTRPTCLKAQT